MIKRFIAALLFMPFTFLGFSAQLTATLQSGDNLSPFYGKNALVDAYNAAVDGDVITLSAGEFNTTEIKKSITVIGKYAFSEDTSKSTLISSKTIISADNVKIEGIRFSSEVTINGADNLTIDRSYIVTLSDTENGDNKYHDNTIITDCLIYDCYAMSLSQNAVFKNCNIQDFRDLNESSYPALIENCNITIFAKWENGLYYAQPYAIYINCFLGLYKNNENKQEPTLNLYSPSEFHNVIFYSNYYHAYPNAEYNKVWTINFNSCVRDNAIMGGSSYEMTSSSYSYLNRSFDSYTYSGLTVGPQNHKEYPAIPEITSAEIDTETDAEGNLHVKISATAHD